MAVAGEDRDGVKVEVGARIRSARILRGISLRHLASDIGVTPGFVSQLENGHSGASVATLRNAAKALGVTVAELLDGDRPNGRGVVRKQERPLVEAANGLTKYLLSTTPLRNLEVYAGTLAPGASTGDALYSHGHAQEMVICLRGTVEVTVQEETHTLEEGDLVELLSSVGHGLRNAGTDVAEVLWIISPPTPD
ncbi:MAG: XRE family transcriptional regulator [Arthrobacter sp.]|uniref:helix-turn-helix domain-containing protein n=1 Tax=Arthrobacter sp. TaxID=1667 RepID=UPI00346F8538